MDDAEILEKAKEMVDRYTKIELKAYWNAITDNPRILSHLDFKEHGYTWKTLEKALEIIDSK